MTQNDLHQSLRDLNDEIERTQTDDEDKQAMLDDIQARVKKVLDDPEGGHHSDLPEPLQNALITFKLEHPSLARAMEITINSLSAMGI